MPKRFMKNLNHVKPSWLNLMKCGVTFIKKITCGSGKLIVALPVSSLAGNAGIVINQPKTPIGPPEELEYLVLFYIPLEGVSDGNYQQTICFRVKAELRLLREITDGNDTGLPDSDEKSMVISKPLHMIGLTMALFARFHVNGCLEDIMAFFC